MPFEEHLERKTHKSEALTMSRGLGRIQRECLRVIETWEPIFEEPRSGTYRPWSHPHPTTYEIAAEVYRIEPDERGGRVISESQHIATKRALATLRRKGLIEGRQEQVARSWSDGRCQRCCFWSMAGQWRMDRARIKRAPATGHGVMGG
jgi:hypothetical protein